MSRAEAKQAKRGYRKLRRLSRRNTAPGKLRRLTRKIGSEKAKKANQDFLVRIGLGGFGG